MMFLLMNMRWKEEQKNEHCNASKAEQYHIKVFGCVFLTQDMIKDKACGTK